MSAVTKTFVVSWDYPQGTDVTNFVVNVTKNAAPAMGNSVLPDKRSVQFSLAVLNGDVIEAKVVAVNVAGSSDAAVSEDITVSGIPVPPASPSSVSVQML
jgi:hypothetical protein